jgi:hypothetical protein
MLLTYFTMGKKWNYLVVTARKREKGENKLHTAGRVGDENWGARDL